LKANAKARGLLKTGAGCACLQRISDSKYFETVTQQAQAAPLLMIHDGKTP
jgi:hypothetical protein